MVDPVVMSFFLAVPVASMLWAVLCFAVALAAFCIQGTDNRGRIILTITIGMGVVVSLLAAVGFNYAWLESGIARRCMPWRGNCSAVDPNP